MLLWSFCPSEYLRQEDVHCTQASAQRFDGSSTLFTIQSLVRMDFAFSGMVVRKSSQAASGPFRGLGAEELLPLLEYMKLCRCDGYLSAA